jgi:hypothetical protein
LTIKCRRSVVMTMVGEGAIKRPTIFADLIAAARS